MCNLMNVNILGGIGNSVPFAAFILFSLFDIWKKGKQVFCNVRSVEN